jgi:hypothetical protein
MENSSDGPLNGLEGIAVGGSGILGTVCTRFVRRFGTRGNPCISGIPRINKLCVFNGVARFDSRRLLKKLKRNAYHHCGHQPVITAAGYLRAMYSFSAFFE